MVKIKNNYSVTANLIGGASSGVMELGAFHPMDVAAKRLMYNQGAVVIKGDYSATLQNMNQVMFREGAKKGPIQKWLSMFPGVGFAAGYKILQRTYKFGGQPLVKDAIPKEPFIKAFGEKKGQVMASAVAGSIMGIGEVALLPLDVLKIKAQTNPEVLQGRGILDIFRKEGVNLYRGGVWTAARNAPGSFALFGGASAVHRGIFGLEEPSQATFGQNFCASVGGAVASITVAQPLDVIKTRIQASSFDSKVPGTTILANLIKNEGPQALLKGLPLKLVVVGPKLVFSFTVAQSVINFLGKNV